jgi:ribosome assembly protein RRB1
MSKRSATEVVTEGQPYAKASSSGVRREPAAEDEMGEFEDAWEDEIESDEEVVDAEAAEREDGKYNTATN